MPVNREHYLDNCKAIAMLLIILEHCGINDKYPFLANWISTFHVPVFFVVSGCILYIKNKKGLLEYRIADKAKSYLIPYVVFSLLYGVFINGIHVVTGAATIDEATIEIAIGFLSQNGCFTACWFLPCLFFAELVFIFECRNMKGLIAIIVNIFLAVVICFIPHENVFVKGFLRIFVGVFFLTVGYYLASIKEKYKLKRKWMALATIICLILNLLMTKWNGHVNTYAIESGNSVLVYYMNAIIGSCALLFISELLFNKEIQWLTWFGRNTIITLCTHQLVIEILWILDNHTICFFRRIGGAVTPFAMWIIVLLLNIPIVYIINNHFYFLIGRKNPKLS